MQTRPEFTAPIPENDAERLAVLRSYGSLDPPRESVFDQLAQRAAQLCETPMATITLVDENRQWFKAKVGLTASETSRATGFCACAVLSPTIFLVPDAAKDSRFARNPFVLGDPHMRAYAGAPLRTPEGFILGTLCVFDVVPREFSEAQIDQLTSLANLVMREIEARKLHAGISFAEAQSKLRIQMLLEEDQ